MVSSCKPGEYRCAAEECPEGDEGWFTKHHTQRCSGMAFASSPGCQQFLHTTCGVVSHVLFARSGRWHAPHAGFAWRSNSRRVMKQQQSCE